MDIHKRISGVYPSPPAASLRDDSDADDACDAVFRISFYHIPDSASLASSASFEFCLFRSIIVFVWLKNKASASFHYKRDGGDDGDGLFCIPYPYPINIVITVSIVILQASRFNLRLACFVFELYGKAFVPTFSELDLDIL